MCGGTRRSCWFRPGWFEADVSYATQNDLELAVGPSVLLDLADRTGSGVIDGTVVAKALADAGELVDSYLGAVVAVPLATVPPAVARHTTVIALYLLHGQAVPDKIATDYQTSLRWLEKVAAGVIKASVLSGSGAGGGAGGSANAAADVRVTGAGRVFGRENLRGL